MRSFHLLVNPSSGSGKASALGVAVARGLRDAGADVALSYSSGESLCRQLAMDAVGRGDIAVAVGGDGMVGSITGEIVRAGGTMGIAPGGRGNDFARQLGLPTDADSICRLLLEAPVRKVDVIEAAGHIVVGSVYAGVDSMSSELVNKAHFLPRSLQYPYAAVRALATFTPVVYTIIVDGVVHTTKAFTVVIANSGYYGSGMHIAPAAAVDDGILDIVIIKAESRYRLLKAMPKLYDGSHVGSDAVRVLTGREVTIVSDGQVTAFGDGEYVSPLPVTARVLPGALNILA